MFATIQTTNAKLKAFTGLAFGCLFCIFSSTLVVRADANFDAGIESYKKRDYKKAQAYFAQAIRQNPSDSNAIYYHALTAQGLGDRATAVRDYASIISHFPSTPAYQYASSALYALDPSYCRQLMKSSAPGPAAASAGRGRPSAGVSSYGGSGGSGQSADFGSLPETSTVYFQSGGGANPLILIPAYINGRPITMCFDTGASGIAVGKNHLAQIGVQPPGGAPVGESHGVGSANGVPIWQMNATIKVGDIIRTMPIMVQENMINEPLLGQTFFNAFTYEIDNNAHSIRFRKKGSGGHGGNFGSADTVPFTRDPHSPTHLIVTAEVNGKPMQMFFDTGAQSCAFTYDQIKQLGITVPDDAQQQLSQGIGGTTTSLSFPIRSIRLGPITKNEIEIHVLSQASMPHPLLGQTFFGDYKYTIDENNNRIIFRR